MKKLFTLLVVSSFLFGCTKNTATNSEEKKISRIAFGSCSAQYMNSFEIYSRILELNPDLYIAGGDNIYGDFFALAPGTKEYIDICYNQLAHKGYFMNFRAKIPEILPIWDDHDTGCLLYTSYYYKDEDYFFFGSELKSILQFPVKKEINWSSVALYFQLNYIPGKNSIFKNIQRLEPGHSLSIQHSTFNIQKWYTIPYLSLIHI